MKKMVEVSLLEAIKQLLDFSDEGMSIPKMSVELTAKFGVRVGHKKLSGIVRNHPELFFEMEGKWVLKR